MTPKQLANRGFLIHALGAILYVFGLIAVLPMVCLLMDFPSIVHFDRTVDLAHSTVVIFNTFVLADRGFTLYYFIATPIILLLAAWGINRLEKGWAMMQQAKIAETLRRQR